MLECGSALASWCSGTGFRCSGWVHTWGEATGEGEQYLFQPQTDWGHCRVYRLQPLAGTGLAGNSVAEGREKDIRKAELKTTSCTMGSSVVGHRSKDIPKSVGGSQISGMAHAWVCRKHQVPREGCLEPLGSGCCHVQHGGTSLRSLAGLLAVLHVAKKGNTGTEGISLYLSVLLGRHNGRKDLGTPFTLTTRNFSLLRDPLCRPTVARGQGKCSTQAQSHRYDPLF